MVPKREVHGGSGSPICMIPIRILGFGDGGTVEDPPQLRLFYIYRYPLRTDGFKKEKISSPNGQKKKQSKKQKKEKAATM